MAALGEAADLAGGDGDAGRGVDDLGAFVDVEPGRLAGPESSVARPLEPDSVEPKLLRSRTFGISSWSCARTVSDMIAPDEDRLKSAERSVPFSGPRRASTSGRSIASPTREMLDTFSFSSVRRTSSGTYLRCRTTRWP